MTVSDLMAEAEERESVAIRMHEANGHVSDFLALEIGHGVVWLHTWTGHQNAHTIEAVRVENRLNERWPDLELIPETKSLFAELRENAP
jgi:hypothetical protein